MTSATVRGFTGRRQLADALGRCRCLLDPDERRLVLELVSDDLGAPVPVGDHRRPSFFVLDLASVCLDNPRILRPLVDALSYVQDPAAAEVESLADALLPEPPFPADDAADLRTFLTGLEVPRLPQLCRDAAGPLQQVPRYDDPLTAFLELQRLNARPDGMPPALALIEHMAVEAPFPTGEALRRWNDRRAEDLEILTELRTLRQQVCRETPAEPTDAYLVVRIEPHAEPGRFRLTSWQHHDVDNPTAWHPRQGETVAVTPHTMERAVEDLVQEAEEDWAREARDIHLEFELGPEELTLPVHRWRKELDSGMASPLCVKYPIVVRSLERARSTRWHRSWKQRWQRLTDHPERMCGVVVGGKSPDDPPYGESGALEARLEGNDLIGCLVLSGPPRKGTEGDREARRGLRAGLPILLWDQRGRIRDPQVGEAGESVENLAVHNLPELHEGMRVLRREAHMDVTEGRQHHVGHHLVLLWDDPTRPVGGEEPLTGPEQGVDGP
jgi:vWA-MoxR associated protein C-terminal domain/vWA-MoxR associated protein middle region 0/Effector-associated domain 2